MKAHSYSDKPFEATYYLRSASLELTSKCNLRCTYCSVSQPDYRGVTMSDTFIEAALSGLRDLKANDVALNGHGETTILGDWLNISAAIRRTGARVHLTSNFARPFSEQELAEMVRLKSVIVSLDTDDAELLRRTRRSVDLNVIMENIRRLRETAARRGVRGPRVIASCVVHTQNVMHLDRFVRFALKNGISGFSLCNLIKNQDLPEVLNVDHVTALPREDLTKAHRRLMEAKGIALSKGATVAIQDGLLDSIEQTLAASGVSTEATVQNKRRHFTKPKRGETRNCLDPWFFALIQADATVRPCCWHPSVGSLKEAPLQAILNSDPAVALRRRLMEGDLDEYCLTCPARPAMSLRDFAGRVREELPANRLAGHIRRMGISLKHSLRRADRALRQLPRAAS